MRTSNDERNAAGVLVNGYDYSRQCWVINGIYAECGHPAPAAHCWSCAHAGEPYSVEGGK